MLLIIARFIGRQKWIVTGLRIRIVAKLVGNERRISPRDFSVNFFGLRFFGNTGSYIDWQIFFLGAYDFLTLNLTKVLLTRFPDAIVLDVGANIGNHTLFMSRHCKFVHAFEPYPRALTQLKYNLSKNGISNVHVHEVGLSNAEQILPYYENSARNMGAGSFEIQHQGLKDSAAYELPLVNGDSYFRSIRLPRLDLVKIDIEGFEIEALEGMRQTIEEYRPALIVEFGPTTRAKIGSLSRFKELFPKKYRFYRITRSGLFRSESPRLVSLNFEHNCNVLAIPDAKFDVIASINK